LRRYRRLVKPRGLTSFEVKAKETDLWILAQRDLSKEALEEVLRLRRQIEAYIQKRPEFATSFSPLSHDPLAPPVVRTMIEAGQVVGVGPMAAVAGALAEGVGSKLLALSEEVIVENGGDVFLKVSRPRKVAIYAGNSPLSMKVGIEVPAEVSIGVCTSSATVGPSVSFGQADAVCVVAKSAALADAAATALGNLVKAPEDIPRAISTAKGMSGVEGVVIIIGDKLGAWGKYPLVEV